MLKFEEWKFIIRVRNKIKARKKGQAQPLNVCQVSTLNHRCVLDWKSGWGGGAWKQRRLKKNMTGSFCFCS